MELTTTIPITTGPRPEYITGYAQIALLGLRQGGIDDDDIRATYLVPNGSADAAFEASQRTQYGSVLAPAAAVKAEMRRLLVN